MTDAATLITAVAVLIVSLGVTYLILYKIALVVDKFSK